MGMLSTLLLVVQIGSALAMIGLILLQHGKGADMGAAFGSGSSGSLFGASGSANFLSRSTAVAATVFLVCTLTLASMSGSVRQQPGGSGSVLDTPAAGVPANTASVPASAAAPAAATPAAGASGVSAIPGQ